MGATVQCENAECRQWLQVPDELRGKMGHCPACGHEFRVSGTLEPAQTLDPQRFFHLRVEGGPDLVGQFIELRPDKLYEFGKADSCTYQLPGRSVSRHHFLVQWVNDQWTVSDLNSTNGTFVNGVRTGRSVLHDNDEIVAGKYPRRRSAGRNSTPTCPLCSRQTSRLATSPSWRSRPTRPSARLPIPGMKRFWKPNRQPRLSRPGCRALTTRAHGSKHRSWRSPNSTGDGCWCV